MRRAQRRGSVLLTLVVGIAAVCSVMAYGVLFAGIGGAHRDRFYWERNPARYAAEAGVVYGMEQLRVDPAWTGPETISVGGLDVTVSIPPCGAPPCAARPLQASVTN